MKKQFVIVGLLACAFINKSIAQEKQETLKEVVVTATKFETNKKNVGKIVYKITSETIKNAQGKTLVDLLNDVPGIEINGNYSTRGQNLGYYIRGGRNKQVAILIDGINVNDPSSISGDFDLRQIDINQIERVEILKGASSVLYGTGASTGVINIILKKSSKKEFAGNFTASVGTNRADQDTKFSPDEFTTNFNFNGTVGKFNYILGLNANGSNGLSAAENNDRNQLFAEDFFERENILLKLGYKINKALTLGLFGNFDQFSTDFDGFNFDPVTFASVAVDKNNNLNNIQKRAGFTADYSYQKGELKVRTFLTDIRRNETPSLDVFQGEVYGFDIFNNYKINNQFSFVTGLTAQCQDMFQKTSFRNIEKGAGKQHFYDPYLAVNYNSDFGFNLNTGARLNIHNEYGSNFVFNVNPSYNFSFNQASNLKLFASYSTAFIAPTLSDIFTKLNSSEDLLPEEDTTVEGGFEVDFSNKVSFNATYFYREETNKIGFDPATFKTINNVGTFNAKGVEAEVVFKPMNQLNLIANYSYVNREENDLLKIPQHKIGAKANYQFLPTTFASLSYKYVDATQDFGGIDLASYSLVDFFINHKIIDNRVTLFANVTNLFNEDYQEIAGFTTRGRNYNFGLRIKL